MQVALTQLWLALQSMASLHCGDASVSLMQKPAWQTGDPTQLAQSAAVKHGYLHWPLMHS